MAVTYTSAGAYLSDITNSEAAADFASWPLFSIGTINVSTRATAVEDASTMPLVDPPGVVVGGDGKSFTATQRSGSGVNVYTVTLNVDADDTAGVEALRFHPDVAIGSTITATTAAHFVTIEMKLKPFVSAAACRVMIPAINGQIAAWTQIPSGDAVAWSSPGFQDKGNAAGNVADVPLSYALPDSSPSFMSRFAFWNTSTGDGVIFRLNDLAGRARVISLLRDSGTEEIIIRVVFIPHDHSIGNNGQSDEEMPYALEVRPFNSPVPATAWYDVDRYHKTRLAAEGHPCFARGKIRNRPRSGDDVLPDRLRKVVAYCAMTATGGSNTEDTFRRYYQNMVNICDTVGDASRVLVVIYNWHDEVLGFAEPRPTWSTGAEEAIRKIKALGCIVLLYTIPVQPAVLSGNTGLPDDSLLNYYLPVDVDGELLVYQVTDSETSDVGNLFATPNWRSNEATDQYLDIIVNSLRTGARSKFDGIYSDAHSGRVAPANDDPTLASADRGTGGESHTIQNRDMLNRFRNRLKAGGVRDPIMMDEHVTEYSAGNADLLLDEAIGPSDAGLLSSRIPSAATIFGQHTIFSNFKSFGDGPTGGLITPVPTFGTEAELMAAVYGGYFHSGNIPSFLRFFAVSNNTWFDPDLMDANYLWFKSWIQKLFFTHYDLVIRYRGSQRLRDMASSHLIRLITATIADDASQLVVDAHRLQHSVWYDEESDVVAVWFTNWTDPDENPITVTFTDTITLAGWPELGSDARNIYITDLDTGIRTDLGVDYNGTSYTFNLAVAPSKMYLVEFDKRDFSAETPVPDNQSTFSLGMGLGL